ncbi:MAG: phosphoenolpyruvate synthase [SAR324 cluster bacterium]|nr:phosphoenolpyruvate synthase [SAR324 cluster bacterium]
MTKPYILNARDASMHDVSLLGGKANNMAWLTRNAFPVPDWLVVTTHAYDQHLQQEGLKAWIKEQMVKVQKADRAAIPAILKEIRQKVVESPFPRTIETILQQNLARIDDWENEYFAVRSSIVGEDAEGASFAGQMESFLFQKGLAQISESVRKCFASSYTDRAILYRIQKGLPLLSIEAAVVVQVMIEGRVSGVLFTAHPVTGSRQHALVSSCYGIGEGIVSGLCNTDEYHVGLVDGTVQASINDKDAQMIFDQTTGRGVVRVDVAQDLRLQPSLSDNEARRVADCGRVIAELLGRPQDIEWAFRENQLYILQTRPITQLPPPAEPRGNWLVWDNSNIQESYCGITTPLTFSFANKTYGEVYRQTMRIMGISPKVIQEHDAMLNTMLGLIQGRVYYNINNWYRGLLFLPSFKTHKGDMERMMGLQDSVDMVQDKMLTWREKIKRLPGLFVTLIRALWKFRQINTLTENFRAMFKAVYDSIDRKALHRLEIGELMALNQRLFDELISGWTVPIINDFYVMMMNGKVHRWLNRIAVENPAVVQNNLLSGEEGIESTEPTKRLLRMCETIRQTPKLQQLFETFPNERLLNAIQIDDPSFYRECLAYIELYGDRTIGELKLESITLRQDASFMFAILRNFLSRTDLNLETLNQNEARFRQEAEELCFSRIRSQLGERKLLRFKKDVERLRHGIKNRENMRLARTRVFGLYRDIYLEISRQMHFYGFFEHPRDIFYLTVEECQYYMDGRMPQRDLKPLIAARKAEFERYKQEPEPAHHFYTKGPVYHHNSFEYPHKNKQAAGDGALKGIGCYPGIVENKVRLIFSPEDELSLNGQILCTVRTDPGWAPLFPTAGGIVVERGSTLSHSAVVARELGIPAIVGIPDITKILKDGETIRMDGATGEVTRLETK